MHRLPAEPTPRSCEEALARYRDLRTGHQVRHDALITRQRRFFTALAAVVILIAVQTANALQGTQSPWPMLLSFAAAIALVVFLVRLQSPTERARRLIAFYDRSLLRAEGSEPHTERTGEDAADVRGTPHLYQHDLDTTGPQSLFSLLATVRTGIGERGLARFLLNPATHEESLARQQAVRELMPQTALRERIALLGHSSFQQISASFFDQWLDAEPPRFNPAFRYALGITAAIAIALILAGLFRLRPWSELLPNLLAVLAIQGAIALFLRSRIAPMLEGGARLRGQVRLFSEGITLLQRSSFQAPRLLELQRLSREPAGAERQLKRLDGWLLVLEQRTKELFLVLSLLTAGGVQAAMAIARWKRRHVPAMRLWLDAWAEFEALNALATYAFEHPPDGIHSTWPELLAPAAPPEFTAFDLGHPLLPEGVRNNILLGGRSQSPACNEDRPTAPAFYLISGSNMAGKSTLMRSIGTAAVLAYAGAPVPAASLRLTPLHVGASIALTDSLAEGKSKFLSEVERLAAIVRLSASTPVLFLVDEIFSGTNSLDRRTAAEAVLQQLLSNRALGALSTHDLALTELVTGQNRGLNVHMASPDPADPLAFDYLLKPGINQHSNALAIIRLLGLNPNE